MAHFAKIENGVVVQVIVAEQEFINTLPGEWLQTSYNTYGGTHLLGGTPFRKNYAGRGFTYDSERDAFIPPRPQFASWVLDEESCVWKAPAPNPNDGKDYLWDEATLAWVAVA